MRRPLVIAHRAGNDLDTLRSALDHGADLVEADVHAYRGRLEVRHHKTLGPWWLWERGELVRRRKVPEVRELLAAAAGDPRLMLDLKGLHPRLAPRLAEILPATTTVTVCTQHWWMLSAFRDRASVRLVLSAGSRLGLRRLRSRLRRQSTYGVCVHRRLLTPQVVTELRRGAEVVLTWPVDTADALADARRLGVDGVIGRDVHDSRPTPN
ncbi:glycerophosphodiester phosphodiesterase [Kribbella soli]|uniref:Glycerophosphodiester phosphodiesterase n=1 Tax=Kribbella soli TaxID=1124743 RepID=A0A4V2LZJ9_9ACTN|nr:glycerophosphodiester phosphodiesterase [Kribbella soli]TCC08496.1 glycerophosphodiester phosphodiesterase [Kribbella soli]